MAWRIEFSDTAVKQLNKMDSAVSKRIISFLKNRLAVIDDPRVLGKPLRGKLSDLLRYRVGDYRIICEIKDYAIEILVLEAGHRKEVYRN
ncbi:MAG: type II toxin-antitoxin system RelE/ParE family toxin [Deinococcaceae bacterium]